MLWKDKLLPGASRIPLPYDGNLAPGWVLDAFGKQQERNDWIMGPQGVPTISGANESQPGYNGPIPGGGNALYAALTSAQGKAAQSKAYADAGLASLFQSSANSAGPTIGGFPIDSTGAVPFLQALGLLRKGKTPEEEERDRLAAMGLGNAS